MIRLKPSMIAGLDESAPDLQKKVCESLQSAIELEHATIPPYLYALYSLDPDKNGAIADIIQSVVVEEMLHMTLSSNILNALDGAPDIDRPDFIPAYPGHLPGGVQGGLEVHLAPFSIGPAPAPDQLQTFLDIETPELPLNFKEFAAIEAVTIGEFYLAISKAIGALGDGAFVDPPRNQIGPDLMPDAIVVTNVATAQAAIRTIVDQGEGTRKSPLEVVGTGYAHYYRFMEIRKGHLLVATPDGGPKPEDKYAYTGDPVPFDPTGVYAVPTDPGGYPAGSPQAFANDNFNYAYTSLLRALHALFNGDGSEAQFNRALGLMMSLKSQAKAMMSGIPNPALLTGPSFQYQPVNPGNS
jgi:hypothetical protein